MNPQQQSEEDLSGFEPKPDKILSVKAYSIRARLLFWPRTYPDGREHILESVDEGDETWVVDVDSKKFVSTCFALSRGKVLRTQRLRWPLIVEPSLTIYGTSVRNRPTKF